VLLANLLWVYYTVDEKSVLTRANSGWLSILMGWEL